MAPEGAWGKLAPPQKKIWKFSEQISIFYWFLAQTRKDLQLSFLDSFRIIKNLFDKMEPSNFLEIRINSEWFSFIKMQLLIKMKAVLMV